MKRKGWYVAFIAWIPGDNNSRDAKNIFDLESLEECRTSLAELPINTAMGYEYQHATAHGPEGEEVDLLMTEKGERG